MKEADRMIKVSYGETEITITKEVISISAPKIILEQENVGR